MYIGACNIRGYRIVRNEVYHIAYWLYQKVCLMFLLLRLQPFHSIKQSWISLVEVWEGEVRWCSCVGSTQNVVYAYKAELFHDHKREMK
jgi:hypothetical protein